MTRFLQHHGLKFHQQGGQGPGLGPHSGKTQQQGEDQSRHDGHDLGDVQLEGHPGQFPQPLHRIGDVQMGDDGVSRSHGEEGGQNAGDIGQGHSCPQQPGSAAPQFGDGGGNEADDDEGHTEGDDLAQNVLQGHHHLHDLPGQDESQGYAQEDAQQQPGGQAFEKFHREPPCSGAKNVPPCPAGRRPYQFMAEGGKGEVNFCKVRAGGEKDFSKGGDCVKIIYSRGDHASAVRQVPVQ